MTYPYRPKPRPVFRPPAKDLTQPLYACRCAGPVNVDTIGECLACGRIPVGAMLQSVRDRFGLEDDRQIVVIPDAL